MEGLQNDPKQPLDEELLHDLKQSQEWEQVWVPILEVDQLYQWQVLEALLEIVWLSVEFFGL